MDCFLKIKKQYEHKKILILGLGIQGGGLEAAKFFAELGAEITVTDLKTKAELQSSLNILKKYPNIEYSFGEHRIVDVDWADAVVRNPGIDIDSTIIKYVFHKKKEFIMPSSFFLKNCPVLAIGITGTRGKSTTANLVYSILKKGLNRRVFLAGNIPNLSALRLIKKIKKNDVVVMELSSWQLQSFPFCKISPNIAILTNIYPDHLNYYKNMQDYIQDKFNILRYQKPTDSFITLRSNLKEYPELKGLIKGKAYFPANNYFQADFKYLIGAHNRKNASLALKVADLLKVPRESSLKTISEFSGLSYRLQLLGTIKSTPFYNDSTCTTPVAGKIAIQALKKQYPKKTISLILGGASKNLPFSDLVAIINQEVKKIYLLPGSFTEEIKDLLSNKIKIIGNNKTVEKLFIHLWQNRTDQEVILFSPCATSFASFKNEFDRANQFDQWFKKYQTRYGT